jgi:hypothetical protein
MKKILMLLVSIVVLTSCSSNSNGYQNSNGVYVTPKVNNLDASLDLQALGELVKSSNSASDIEAKLNTEGSINNLDLDNDGNVDYIQVGEYGNSFFHFFSFTTDNSLGDKQQIATIDMRSSGGNIIMNIGGNQNIYGPQAYYTSNYLLRDFLIYNYVFGYHPFYHSPYHYGYYPRTYHVYHRAPYRTYRNRVSTTTRTTRIR